MYCSHGKTREKKILLHATPTDTSRSEVPRSAESVSALWHVYARWDVLCGDVTSWPWNYCLGNNSTGNPLKGIKSSSAPSEHRLVKPSWQNQTVGFQGLGAGAAVLLRGRQPGCYICTSPTLAKIGCCCIASHQHADPFRRQIPDAHHEVCGAAAQGQQKVRQCQKSPVERTTEAPGKLSKALTWVFLLVKRDFLSSLPLCEGGMARSPLPRSAGSRRSRLREVFPRRWSHQGRSQLGRSWANRWASNTSAGSRLVSGKVLGCCWRGISPSRNLFLPASKSKQKAWVAVSAMWVDRLTWPRFIQKRHFQVKCWIFSTPGEHGSSKFYMALGSWCFINKAFPDA